MQCPQCRTPLRHDPAAQKYYCDSCRLAYPVNISQPSGHAQPPSTTQHPAGSQPQSTAQPSAASRPPGTTQPPAGSQPSGVSQPRADSRPSQRNQANPPTAVHTPQPQIPQTPSAKSPIVDDRVFKVAVLGAFVVVIGLLVSILAVGGPNAEKQTSTQSLGTGKHISAQSRGSVIILKGGIKISDILPKCLSATDSFTADAIDDLMLFPLLEKGWRLEGQSGAFSDAVLLRSPKRLELPCSEALLQALDPDQKMPSICRRVFLKERRCRTCRHVKGVPRSISLFKCQISEMKRKKGKKDWRKQFGFLMQCLSPKWIKDPKVKEELSKLKSCLSKKDCEEWIDCVDAVKSK